VTTYNRGHGFFHSATRARRRTADDGRTDEITAHDWDENQMDASERERVEFTKKSVRQILSPRFSMASIIAAGCLIAYVIIRFPSVADRLPFLPEIPPTAAAWGFVLLVISVVCGFSAVRKRFARGRYTGAACMIASVVLLFRRLQEIL